MGGVQDAGNRIHLPIPPPPLAHIRMPGVAIHRTRHPAEGRHRVRRSTGRKLLPRPSAHQP